MPELPLEAGRRAMGRSRVAALFLTLLLPAGLAASTFIRGDANGDGVRDISDAQFTLSYLFLEGRAPACEAALDANDDESIDLSDAIAELAYLFLGGRALPPPGPLPGTDPTPGLPCGLAGPSRLACAKRGPAVDLSFEPGDEYDSIAVSRDGLVVASLPGEATRYRDLPPRGGEHLYELRGVRGEEWTDAAACRVVALPENSPPIITVTAPAPGTVVNTATIQVRGRVTDDGGVVRVAVGGVEALPAGPPRASADFTAAVPLATGPGLLRLEAVDEFGRASFAEVPVGRQPLLASGQAGAGLSLFLSGGTGYGELAQVFRPLIDRVPALVDGGIRGALLYEGSIVGVGIRVTGRSASVTGPIALELLPSAAAGGRIDLRIALGDVRVDADGRSDFGFLGTDSWTAVWTARGASVRGGIAFRPRPGGAGLDVVSDGFQVSFASSNLAVSGFLDPLGVFDAVVNSLATLFRSEIEAQVKGAAEGILDSQLLPALRDAANGLDLSLDLGGMTLRTWFKEVEQSERGLSVLFDALWKGTARDPSFPRLPGSAASFPPPPGFPLAVGVAHPVDAVFSLSRDALDQALAEAAAGGIVKGDLPLPGAGSPFPPVVGTLASLLDARLAELPGVSAEDPLGVRARLALPPEILLGQGRVGSPLVGEGAVWRYRKGTSNPPQGWTQAAFDDSRWERGPSGFGFSETASELRDVRTELADMAAGGYVSLEARARFTVADPSSLDGLFLRVLYDDGFAAYLNGQEVARVNLPGAPGSSIAAAATALSAVEPTWSEIDLGSLRSLLRPGENVLAVEGHNSGSGSTDFVLLPVLLAPLPPPAGTLASLPVQLEVRDLIVSLVADTAADGVGAGDKDGAADEVDLLAFRLSFRLQGRVLLTDSGGTTQLALDLAGGDGPDPDKLPDALVGGAAGITIGVAMEAIDVDDRTLLEFAELSLTLLAPSLGDALAAFRLPSFPLPELSFDLDRNGAPDLRLEVKAAGLAAVDTTGDSLPDWICVLTDLRPVSP